jgi:hypothetical protein
VKKEKGKGKNKKTVKPVEKVLKTNVSVAKTSNAPEEIKVNSETKLIETKKAPAVNKPRRSPVAKSQTTKTSAPKVTKASSRRKTTAPRKKVVPKTPEQKEEIEKS